MLFVAFGLQGVLISLVVLAAVIVGARLFGDDIATSITSVGGLWIAVPFFLVEALKIVGGIALLRRRPWARILVLTLSFPSLVIVPIGTAYGIYSIWVLMKDDTARLFAPAAD